MSVSSKTPRRIMALWFPRLPTDRLQRQERMQDGLPLVLVAKVDNALRLSSVDRKATSLGLAAGQPLANARAMLPELKVVAANDPADLKLLDRIADWCDRFTPYVAMDGPRSLLLDVTGAAHLFGGEQELLNRVRENLKIQGFAVRGAVAGTAVAARAFARYRDGIVIVPGEEAKAIASLPIEALNLDDMTTHAFRRAGLKTVGQVAARKRSELVARFGAATLAVLDEALGKNAKPISPRKPPPDYWREQNFAEPITTEEAIRSTLNSLAMELVKILEQQCEGARHLEAVFLRTDGKVRRIAIEMGEPTRDPAIITRLFHEKLAALSDPLDPGFGFDLVRLCATHVERTDPGSLNLSARANEKAEIGFLLDRLATRFGGHRVLAFQTHDTHIPEKAWVVVPAQYAEPQILPWQKIRNEKDAPRRPIRLFVNPEPVDLITRKQISWRKMQRDVAQSEGPERITMEWWRQDMPQATRDYFRIEDEQGKRYWVYRNNITSKWFMHGSFA